MSDYGVVYISFGPEYVDCTYAALISIVKNSPNTPVCLVTNREDDVRSSFCRDNKIEVAYHNIATEHNRVVKTQIYKYVPKHWKWALYLDCDSVVNGALDSEFHLLKSFPLCMTMARANETVRGAKHLGNKDLNHTINTVKPVVYPTQFNGGIILFRPHDPVVRRFFDVWYAEWKLFKYRDQGALIRAIFKTGICPYMLARDIWFSPVCNKGLVCHESLKGPIPTSAPKGHKSRRIYTSIP